MKDLCKICHTAEVTHYAGICATCRPAYDVGSREGKNRLIKDTCQELREINN